MVHARILIAVDGPLSLEMSLGGAELPEQGQVVRKVGHKLGISIECHDIAWCVRVKFSSLLL